MEALKSQIEEQESRHHDDMKDQAKMLDIKTARATELESRLKDIAYGTHQYKLESKTSAEDEGVDGEKDVILEHGQNLLQFGLNQVNVVGVSNEYTFQNFVSIVFHELQLKKNNLCVLAYMYICIHISNYV